MSEKVPEFYNPEFENFETRINNVMEVLEKMTSTDKDTQNEGITKADTLLKGNKNLDDISEENFIAQIRYDRTVINNKDNPSMNNNQGNDYCKMDKFAFMQQLETDANQRAENRKERQNIAQSLRKIGNEAFRTEQYEKAINLYTKAIDHVKDSPIIYNNRALSYIRLKLYKRAIIDCDFVINKLDDKNLRAWLYRATAYYCLNDEYNFNASIKMAKKTNSKEIDYIDKFIVDMKSLV